MMPQNPEKCLVSACLAGLCTRYDGRSKPSAPCLRQMEHRHWIPVCPEQLGGLPTPRTAAELVGGDGHEVLAGRAAVINHTGLDVSDNFIRGARQCLAIARARQIKTAYLKAGSPSCSLTPQIGVTAALLQQHGCKIIEF
jgi:uncharacterized protein YbbK (DUF523 family)